MFEGLPENYIESFEYLQSKLPDNLKSVKMAIVCGSGLNNLAEKISDIIEFDYKVFIIIYIFVIIIFKIL